MTLDHGALNIPGRTSSIDADLDRHMKAQAAEAKAKARSDAAVRKELKAQAKALLAQHGEGIVCQMTPRIAKRRGITLLKATRDIKRTLDCMAKWEPAQFIALVDRHLQA